MLSAWDRAPPRGCYDRSLSATTRHTAQRRRVLGATAEVAGRDGLQAVTVSKICRAALVGRNTFYGLFADVPTALHALVEDAAALLDERLAEAAGAERAPQERVRALCRGWLAFACDEAPTVRTILGAGRGPEGLSQLGEVFRHHLGLAVLRARADGALALPPDYCRATSMAAAAEAAALIVARSPASGPELDLMLPDIILRSFR